MARENSLRRPLRRGQSLLELIGATTVMAIALVPALRIMRDAVRVGRTTELANLMATFSVSKLEEALCDAAASWDKSTLAGTFTAEGYPTVRFHVDRSDSTADGGIPGALMSITSTVWEDRDADSVWDTGELRSVFATKLARCVAYTREAGGN